jgi:beta-lactamase superfamily II metal-dependent hydrolase
MRSVAVLCALVFACTSSAFAQANGKLQIHYMDVGQGDGAVLISPLGEVVLFDDGVLDQCAKPVAYLQSLGITRIDYHIASHYHSDHIGCAPTILSMFPLQKAAYDRGGAYTTATYTAYVAAVGAKRVTAVKGQSITLDAGSSSPVTITFVALNGNGVSTTDENDLSLVAVVRFGQFDAEFGGDLSGAGTGAIDPDPATPGACSYSASPTSLAATTTAGTITVSVTTTFNCAWTTTSSASWIGISTGTSAIGSGTATLAYQANTGAARTGTATVAGKTITITQAADSSTPPPPPPSGCCKVCTTGKPCGDSCISSTLTCHVGPGCACSTAGGDSYTAALPWINYSPVQGPMPDAVADIESSAAALVGQIEVYKVHHHGSKTSSNSGWLAITTPKVGIISASNSNTYGHPTAEALTRLHAAGVKTYWTSVGNGVGLVSGQDFATTGSSVVVEAAPATTTFTVRYGSAIDTYSVHGAAPPPVPAAPFGTFDTPTDGTSGITGAIAVTGWALDNTGVARVDIQRDAHPNDPAGAVVNGRVFVGTATFVTGARPDLAGLYANYPNASSGGWGYLMLTRGVVWDGQGAFNLYAIATDTQGNTASLGSKRITIDNAIATKPFGNIDTPGQGQTVTGTFVNFGWVLPLTGRTVPAASVKVAIDGVFLPQSSECLTNRADIDAGFASFDTSQAIRCFTIDSTRYSNGVHTIGWLVTDSTGQTDGIGSRFFTIANASSVPVQSPR